jgi:2-methylcitrate dehydratase PrpD
MRRAMHEGLPPGVIHEAKRLTINQLKASVGASRHPAVTILRDWAVDERPDGPAHMLWIGTSTGPAQACMVNGALFEVLDFHDTYIPTFMHAVSAVLPAVMAEAEVGGQSGAIFLSALAIGLEVELACATMLMPTGYYRGAVPAGLVGGIGAAAACCVLAGLDEAQMINALGLAMCTAFGLYESVGSMALSYITGATARSGLTAFQLARRGMDAPRTAFEGEKGMFAAHTDEDAAKIDGIVESLGSDWRIFGQSYKTVPTETITHGPIECVLGLSAIRKGRTVARMRFAVQPIVVTIADERRMRFGDPKSELEARFDLRYCAAAAWVRGRFTLAEMERAAFMDPDILDLRSRIDLVADASFETFEGCALEISFTDGSTESARIPAFRGTPANPIIDGELSALFRASAAGLLAEGRVDAILDGVWTLDSAATIRPLMALLMLA